MFPRIRQTLSTAVVDRIDDFLEFSTLGEYVLADDLRPIATGPGDRACEGARIRPASHAGTARPVRERAIAARDRSDCPPPDWAWPAS